MSFTRTAGKVILCNSGGGSDKERVVDPATSPNAPHVRAVPGLPISPAALFCEPAVSQAAAAAKGERVEDMREIKRMTYKFAGRRKEVRQSA